MGKSDFREFEAFAKRLEKLNEFKAQEISEACVKEMAARMLAKVIKRTPVGDYPTSAKRGGTLRRGWTAKTHSEAEGGANKSNVTQFLSNVSVTKKGNMYMIEITNPVEYASYVEFGHRTRNHKGWVNGRYMMTISAQEVQSQAPAIVDKKLEKMLREAFNDSK